MFTSLKLREMFSHKRLHTMALVRFCIDTMYEVAQFEYKAVVGEIDFQVCNGAVYIMIRLLSYVMKDQGVEDQYLWQEKGEIKDSKELVPLGIKLCLSIMHLLFKPGYTVRPIHESL
jgi:hypothetical protein